MSIEKSILDLCVRNGISRYSYNLTGGHNYPLVLVLDLSQRQVNKLRECAAEVEYWKEQARVDVSNAMKRPMPSIIVECSGNRMELSGTFWVIERFVDKIFGEDLIT